MRPDDDPGTKSLGEIFREVEPEDLLKFGLIPEFVELVPGIIGPRSMV